MNLPWTEVLAEKISPINGRIRVLRSLGLGTYIQVENLTQSGGVVAGVWKTTLKKVKRRKKEVETCLILGLGGGSAATLVKKFWPDAKVTGVDIDPIMVSLGKKYLGLAKIKVEIGDAKEFLRNKRTFDLILVDTYIGENFPEKFEKEDFLLSVKKSLSEGGIAVFNRLYYGEKRPLAIKFGERLDKIFGRVERVFPEANIMFLANP
jgi:spermidine synthase